MRVDTEHFLAMHVLVTLDGKQQLGVICADEEAGTVARYVQGDDGRFIIEDGQALTEVVTGRVQIELKTQLGMPTRIRDEYLFLRGQEAMRGH